MRGDRWFQLEWSNNPDSTGACICERAVTHCCCSSCQELLMKHVRAALKAKGIDDTIGAATTAAAVGVEDSLIKTLGRLCLSGIQFAGSVWQQFPGDWLTQLDSLLDYIILECRDFSVAPVFIK